MRLIDADALIKKLGVADLPIRLTYEINNMPTIDAVPVVRCRECIHQDKQILKFHGQDYVSCWCLYTECTQLGEDDDFCSRGERKK